MADDLQEIVDDLAERLQRSVAIDDPSLRLLAASRHFGDEDELRVSSVLNRSIEPEIRELVFAQGIAQWTGPGKLAAPVEQARHRLCAPIRCAGLLLGYLWLIDSGSSFSERHRKAAREVADRAGAVLYRRLVVHERTKARHEAILWELVSTDRAVRSQAVDDLRAEQLFPSEGVRFQIIGVQRLGPDGAASEDVALESAVEEAGNLHPTTTGSALMAANRSRAWLLLGRRKPPARQELDEICARLTERFARLTDGSGRLVLGIGGVVDRIGHIADSYRQAFLAARGAALIPSLGPVARWGELGPYELLLTMPADNLLAASEVPALRALENGSTELLATLEAYLDNAGDVARTAAQLTVHRATLYHRLKRIERLSGCALNRGEDRLTLHLGLKLRALAAAYRNEPAAADPRGMRSVS